MQRDLCCFETDKHELGGYGVLVPTWTRPSRNFGNFGEERGGRLHRYASSFILEKKELEGGIECKKTGGEEGFHM